MRVRRTTLAIAIGLASRVVLVVAVAPVIQLELFSPFLEHTLHHPSWDPWQIWLDSGGRSDAFPYGPVMLGYFLVFVAATAWLPIAGAAQLGIALGILAIDLLCWFLLGRAEPALARRALVLFAASPVVLFAAYVHGQLDLLPAAVILLAVLRLRRSQWMSAGVLLGIAIATKFSAGLVLLVVIVFFARNPRFRAGAGPFALGLVPGVVLAAAPALLPGYRTMVLATPQVKSLITYGVDLGPGLTLLIGPVGIAALLVAFWWFRRANPDIVALFCTLLLAVVPLLAPASPGWFLWSAPLIALLASRLPNSRIVMLLTMFSAIALSSAMTNSWAVPRWAIAFEPGTLATEGFHVFTSDWVGDLIGTAAVTVGLVVLWLVGRGLLGQFDIYHLSTAPLSVAVAGDSGTGKDTLGESIANVFAGSRAAFILGDDYHSYERGSPVWQVKTHLDPSANNVARLVRDTVQLLSGNSIWSRRYDHARGRFTAPQQVVQGDLVMVSGLHVLSSLYIREHVDLTVFLDMDEGLRTLLKVNRDERERGHAPGTTLEAISRRAADRESFIQPQRALADLVIRLEPVRPIDLTAPDLGDVPPIDFVATLRGFALAEDLVRAMTSVAGAQVAIEYLADPGQIEVRVSGADWLTATDIAAVARYLISRPEEVFLQAPVWFAGSRGVSQLILVLCLLERRTKVMEFVE